MKKFIKTILLAVTLTLGILLLAGCNTEKTAETDADTINVFALKGPTGMGMAKLMNDNDNGESVNKYNFTIASAPDEVTAEIIKGNYDIAAVPTNLAAVLYNKTEGNIRIAAVNTLGVLYIMENGNTVGSLADLEGKTIYATGQGSTPEYILNYILTENGINCEVEYLAEHAELAAQMISGDVAVGMLPVPNVTAVLAGSDARVAIDLTKEWDKIAENKETSSALYQGCIVINPEFIENHPKAVEAFLNEYAASVEYINNNTDNASVMIAEYGIIPKAEVAKQAIPDANMVCITGKEMAENLDGFFKVLFDSNPASIGGSLPSSDIYYSAK